VTWSAAEEKAGTEPESTSGRVNPGSLISRAKPKPPEPSTK